MGYQTEFTGSVTVTPPLNAAEVTYLRHFADTRHNKRQGGPYTTTRDAFGPDVVDDWDHDGMPGYWCNWEATDDGSGIEWNGAEKFYDADTWMQYLIDHFLKPGAVVQKCLATGATGLPELLQRFTFDHVVNGAIEAQGEDPSDRWQLIVTDNVVTRA